MKSKICTTTASQNGGALFTTTCPPNVPSNSCQELIWYALQTRRRSETRVDAALTRKGIETFLPLVRQHRRGRDNRPLSPLPLFPGYIFSRLSLNPEVRLRVLQTPGAVDFVCVQEAPAPIATSQIENLRRLLLLDCQCSIRPLLRSGQRVRIRGGALDGLEGILLDTAAKHLVISIDCLERSVAFVVEGYDLEVA